MGRAGNCPHPELLEKAVLIRRGGGASYGGKKSTKVKTDLLEYNSIIESHQKQMTFCTRGMEDFESRFENNIKRAKIYPNWAVVVFILNLFWSSSLLYFFVFKLLRILKII